MQPASTSHLPWEQAPAWADPSGQRQRGAWLKGVGAARVAQSAGTHSPAAASSPCSQQSAAPRAGSTGCCAASAARTAAPPRPSASSCAAGSGVRSLCCAACVPVQHDQSSHQATNLSTNQSINQSITQSINHSMNACRSSVLMWWLICNGDCATHSIF